MKYVLLLLALISMSYCSTSCGDIKPSTYLGCLTGSASSGYYCCYFKGTLRVSGGVVTDCREISKSLIDDNVVYDTIKAYEIFPYSHVDSLFCSGSYLAVGLLSLIALLF